MLGLIRNAARTIRFGVLYIFLVLAHDRRRVVHFNVTANPTAECATRQVTETFPYDEAPRYMIRDRNSIYGDVFRGRVKAMGINEVLIAPRSPWQNPFVERLIGSIRREALDSVIVVDERHLQRGLHEYLAYYHAARCHLARRKDAPNPASTPETTTIASANAPIAQWAVASYPT
ncbi:MAG: transposase [Deltaproteobacteria bacterium]|nr:transposase [Deltaproteobacteria bacterium]